jgi:plastocyanin
MHPRPRPSRTSVVVLAALLASAGCSSESESESGSGAETGSGSGSSPAAEVGATLLATVGTEDDPESFEIALTTEDGATVEALAAGDYTIEVVDYAMIHNFALRGPGVEEQTSVSDVEEATFEVTLEPGEYEYLCDPHPSMSGTVQVTA